MPEVFLGQTAQPVVKRTRSRWTVTGSFVLHAVLVVAILIAPVLGPPTLPPFTRPLVVVFAEPRPVPPAPAVPQAQVTPPTTTPPVIPFEAPTGFHPERPAVPTGPPVVGVPGGLDLRVAPGSSFIPDGRGMALQTITPPKPAGPIRPGGNILPPARTGYVAPVYPPIAIQARSAGTVILEAVIDETGTVRDVTVIRSVPLLDRSAIDAVRQWRYSPTRLNGVPVAIIMTVSVTFTLK
jgi:protein TonB